MIESWCGIPQADLPTSLTLFIVCNQTRRRNQEGLAIAKRIVEIHESRMEVDSTINVGTTYLSPAYCSD
ncbi:MAG: sensor histidine kinase [Nitrospirales bacterium]|nr:sensor histidine kinase [Nitrospirales bacterium]